MDRNAGTIETLLPRPLPSEGSARLLLFGFRRLAAHGLRDAHALLCDVLNVEYCLGALSSAQAVAQAFEDLGRPLTAFSPSC
jgi:hypothetical protein